MSAVHQKAVRARATPLNFNGSRIIRDAFTFNLSFMVFQYSARADGSTEKKKKKKTSPPCQAEETTPRKLCARVCSQTRVFLRGRVHGKQPNRYNIPTDRFSRHRSASLCSRELTISPNKNATLCERRCFNLTETH